MCTIYDVLSHFMLFCCKIVRKSKPRIAPVEKKWLISGMCVTLKVIWIDWPPQRGGCKRCCRGWKEKIHSIWGLIWPWITLFWPPRICQGLLYLLKKLVKFLWKSWWDKDGEQKRRSESVIIGHRFRRTWASIFTWPCRGNKSTHTWVSFILKTQWELMIFFYIAWLMLLFWDCLKISIDRFSGWAGQTV